LGFFAPQTLRLSKPNQWKEKGRTVNPLVQLKKVTPLFVLSFVFACLAFLPQLPAVNPPPDGAYPGGNTAEGFNALFHLSPQDGGFNTAIGFYALFANTTGSFNTAVGAGALDLNTGHNNTATGAAALLLNTTGNFNTAVGTGALTFNNETGNTAVGAAALNMNTVGQGNTAVGAAALTFNVNGPGNTAVGAQALQQNTEGGGNTAVGALALKNNAGGLGSSSQNTAVGQGALETTTGSGRNTALGRQALNLNTMGNSNTAVGADALSGNSTGSDNIAVGDGAGGLLTTGSNNIDIGNDGVANEANTVRIGTSGTQTDTYIAGIYGRPPGANTLPVVCADNGKLTANASSRRFKHDIKQMDSASEAILALKAVSFRYNNDSTNTPWFGLIAEDVAEVNPDLIARDKEGKPFGVRYDQVNVMLLNEFLKEHRKVEELQKQVEALTAGLQKVSAQLEVSKHAPRTVLNTQ
jgi:trimeric autotransporter adhesin